MFFRKSESISWVPSPTPTAVKKEIAATIKANQNQPRLSPAPPFLLIEKKRTIGMITTLTMLPPMVEPIRAKVAVFSRSCDEKDKAGIMDQKPISLKE